MWLRLRHGDKLYQQPANVFRAEMKSYCSKFCPIIMFQTGINLTFIGLCIVIYFRSKTNELHQFLKLILFCSNTLNVSVFPSIIRSLRLCIQHQLYVRFCWLRASEKEMEHLVPASTQSAESVWHISDAVCTVLDSWWWTKKPSETCSHSFSSLSCDRSKASSKASSPHSAIQSFLFQMRVSSSFLKVIQ